MLTASDWQRGPFETVILTDWVLNRDNYLLPGFQYFFLLRCCVTTLTIQYVLHFRQHLERKLLALDDVLDNGRFLKTRTTFVPNRNDQFFGNAP